MSDCRFNVGVALLVGVECRDGEGGFGGRAKSTFSYWFRLRPCPSCLTEGDDGGCAPEEEEDDVATEEEG